MKLFFAITVYFENANGFQFHTCIISCQQIIFENKMIDETKQKSWNTDLSNFVTWASIMLHVTKPTTRLLVFWNRRVTNRFQWNSEIMNKKRIRNVRSIFILQFSMSNLASLLSFYFTILAFMRKKFTCIAPSYLSAFFTYVWI